MDGESRTYTDLGLPPGVGRAIAAIAAQQEGVVFVEQLRENGLDKDAVNHRVEAGLLHRLYRGVYAVGHRKLSYRGRLLAAVVACGHRAALSHRAAAFLWDLAGPPARIEVTIPHGLDGPKGIVPRRTRMVDPRDCTTHQGIRVTTVARTLLDLAATVTPLELNRLIDRAERLELLDLREIEDVLSRARGRRGAKALRRAIEAWRPRYTRSELEDRFADFIAANNLSCPIFNVVVQGENHGHEVDAYWPQHRLAIELDSFAYHRTRMDHKRDAAKQADLELAGITMTRLNWDDVTKHASRTLRRLQLRMNNTPASGRVGA